MAVSNASIETNAAATTTILMIVTTKLPYLLNLIRFMTANPLVKKVYVAMK